MVISQAYAPPKTLAVDLKHPSTQEKKCKRLPSAKKDDIVRLLTGLRCLRQDQIIYTYMYVITCTCQYRLPSWWKKCRNPQTQHCIDKIQ